MRIDPGSRVEGKGGGFVLPIVLLLMSGLWLLCLSLISLATVAKRSGHLRMTGLQAELAMQAGLHGVKSILLEGCSQDDHLIIEERSSSVRQPARLHLVRPSVKEGQLHYEFTPLFSWRAIPPPRSVMQAPQTLDVSDGEYTMRAYPWLNPVALDWQPVHDEKGELVARHAFWVEDLEGRIDPSLDLEAIRLDAMDDDALGAKTAFLGNRRHLMASPDSALAAAGLTPPLPRQEGLLVDPWADFLERSTFVGLRSYEERATVPYVRGISPDVMGRTKLNLNHLLSEQPDAAIRRMADWIAMALPDFELRQGGYPDDYLQTLAANAIDYADLDREPLLQPGHYRGIDGQPFLSEVVLHLHFQGLVQEEGRWVLKWTLRLFAELWNLSNQPIQHGQARLSYEVNLRPTAVGLGGGGMPFDSPMLLEDPQQSSHALQRVEGRYLTPAVEVNLLPDAYRFYEFAKVDYAIDCSPQLNAEEAPRSEWFDLVELEHEARGLSLIWNGQEVERIQRIHRDPYGLANFRTDQRRKTAKACIPGLNYGGYASMVNNPGDPRASHHLRTVALGENAYPENISPHRRNLRRRNIYDRDPSPYKTRHYGRVMPSQWPDGGHDSVTGDFRVTTSDARFPTDPDWWPYAAVPTPQAAHAPQSLSNRGVFRSVTELGHIYDPVMWTPAYPDLEGEPGSGRRDSDELLGLISMWKRPAMPIRRGQWPEVSWRSIPSAAHGGGHTLRMGRPEHQRFDEPGMRASHLLDLFHCGQPAAENLDVRQGPTTRVHGRVNLNTASREVLRCMAYGALSRDEAISRVVDPVHDLNRAFGPKLEPWRASEAQLHRVADAIADGILRARPFASLSELAQIRDVHGQALFGNPTLHLPDGSLQWSDAAAEELFDRVHAGGGLRSRHFRVWVVGQSVRQRGDRLEVLATRKRTYDLFVDPGVRSATGQILPENQTVKVLHVRDF